METVIAIFEHGVFRPLGPVNLSEYARVRVEPITDGEAPGAETFTPEELKAHPLLAILGIGESEAIDDASERDEEILASNVHPIYGWTADPGSQSK